MSKNPAMPTNYIFLPESLGLIVTRINIFKFMTTTMTTITLLLGFQEFFCGLQNMRFKKAFHKLILLIIYIITKFKRYVTDRRKSRFKISS